MYFSLSIFLFALTATSLAALRYIALIWSALQKRYFLHQDCEGSCKSLGFVGCSFVCSGVSSIVKIEKLLSSEYDRYEVIVVLDAQIFSEHFSEIINHYRMIKVNNSPSEEFPLARIRNLYRSKARNFRRLILIDREQASPYEDFDAAAAIASYGYLIPITDDCEMQPLAIESIATILSDSANKNIDLIISHIDKGCYIFRRQTVVEQGGFSLHLTREIDKRNTLDIFLPICTSCKNSQHKSYASKIAILLIPLAILVAAKAIWGWGATVATIATLLLLVMAAKLSSCLCGTTSWSRYNIFWFIRQIFSFFRTRKFII